MNNYWEQDYDNFTTTTNFGFPSMSANVVPVSAARNASRFFLAVLILAGLLGAAFQLVHCAGVVAQVIHPHPTTVPHRKDR